MADETGSRFRFSRAIFCAGLTTGQYARAASTTPRRVAEVRGGADPTADELAVCARVCEVSLEWLTSGIGRGPCNRPQA